MGRDQEHSRYRDSSLQSSSSSDTVFELHDKSHNMFYQDEVSSEDGQKEDRDVLLSPYVEKEGRETEPKIALEYTVPTTQKLMALGIYFLCNVGLTLYNKAVLGSLPYPWLLTALHTGCASIGCYILLLTGRFELKPLGRRESYTLCAFSLLFTVNIAVSNVSLAMVSIPFHQVVRATTPLVTTAIYRLFYSRTYSMPTYLSLLPIILGVGLATYGDYSYTTAGFLMTFLGVILGALKSIVTNQIMTGSLKLAPLEFLFRMSPLACLQSLIYGVWSGEVSNLMADVAPIRSLATVQQVYGVTALLAIILCNGFLAFCLNVSSFTTNKLVGALTMTVCGNLKQCITIILGVVLFNVEVGFFNAAGLVVTMAGVAAYSSVELHSKRKRTQASGSV